MFIPTSLIITIALLALIIFLTYLLLNNLKKHSLPESSSSQEPIINEIISDQTEETNFLNSNPSQGQVHEQQHQISHQHQENIINTNIDPNKKLTKKEQIKMIKKQERAEQREYQKQLIEAKKLKEQQREKEMLIKEKMREEEKKKLEDELQRVKEEQEKKENEIYNQWKDMIKVGEEGEDRMDFTDEKVINDFLEYIKIRKVVSLEDLSGVFKIPTNELVERLNLFEQQGRILGIIDDRGKYIYITEKEMSMIEKMFANRGRITKSELIKECNRLIKFEPNEEDKSKIAEEQKKMLEKIESEINQSK